MADEQKEVGVAVSVQQLMDIDYNAKIVLPAVDANYAARALNDSFEIREKLKNEFLDPALAKMKDNSLPSSVKEKAAADYLGVALYNADRAGKEVGLSRELEKELNEVLATLPEGQRAAYTAGFLYHHDLMKVVDPNSKDPRGNYVYESNPDMNRPHPGNYIPTLGLSKVRTPE